VTKPASILVGGEWLMVDFLMSGGGWTATTRPEGAHEVRRAHGSTKEDALRKLADALRLAAA
jgi:hypothetical protein